MSQIYIITKACGQYDGYHIDNICAVSSKDTAQDFVSKLKKLQEFNEKFKNRIEDEFERTYDFVRPVAPIKPEASAEFKQLQKSLSGTNGKGSPELKRQFKNLQLIHMTAVAEYNCKKSQFFTELNAAHYKHKEARDKWIVENYLPSSEFMHLVKYLDLKEYYSYSFSYHELELID